MSIGKSWACKNPWQKWLVSVISSRPGCLLPRDLFCVLILFGDKLAEQLLGKSPGRNLFLSPYPHHRHRSEFSKLKNPPLSSFFFTNILVLSLSLSLDSDCHAFKLIKLWYKKKKKHVFKAFLFFYEMRIDLYSQLAINYFWLSPTMLENCTRYWKI